MKRDVAIDLLKFLAVICVVNSHMDICYPERWRALATGGAIGDALFFFCSGFTLFIGRNGSFPCWYKRRLARIFPSVLICLLAYSCFHGKGCWEAFCSYWFVRCILIYYIALFFVRRYCMKNLWIPFALWAVAITIWFALLENQRHNIYGGGSLMWGHYFLPMLAGAVIGLKRGDMKPSLIFDGLGLLICLAGFYGVLYFATTRVGFEWLQLLTTILLSGIIVFLYRMARSDMLTRLMSKGIGKAFVVIGGLCLEVYLSHRVFVTGRFNGFFPLNIVGIFACIIVWAYFVRCVSRFMVQTFDGQEGYDFAAIFELR